MPDEAQTYQFLPPHHQREHTWTICLSPAAGLERRSAQRTAYQTNDQYFEPKD